MNRPSSLPWVDQSRGERERERENRQGSGTLSVCDVSFPAYLLDVLRHANAGDVVVVPLLHGAVGVVHGDPLEGGNSYSDLLLGRLLLILVVQHVPRSLLPHLGQSALADLDGPVERTTAEGLEQCDHPAVLGILVVLQVHHVLGELLEPEDSIRFDQTNKNQEAIRSASQRKSSKGRERKKCPEQTEREGEGLTYPGGEYLHICSADVAIFFLHTRKPLLSPWYPCQGSFPLRRNIRVYARDSRSSRREEFRPR